MTMAREKCEMWKKREVYSLFRVNNFLSFRPLLDSSTVLDAVLYGVCSISSRFSEEGGREREERMRKAKQNKTKKATAMGLIASDDDKRERISTILNSKVPSPENLTATWEGSDCSEKKLWKWSLTFNRLTAIKIIFRWAKRELKIIFRLPPSSSTKLSSIQFYFTYNDSRAPHPQLQISSQEWVVMKIDRESLVKVTLA